GVYKKRKTSEIEDNSNEADNDLGVVITNEDSDEEWRPSTASRTSRKGLKAKRQPKVYKNPFYTKTPKIEDNSNEADNDFGEEMAANEDSGEEWRPSTSAVDKRLKGKCIRPVVDETEAIYQCDLEDCDYSTHLWPNLVAHRKTHDNPMTEDNRGQRQGLRRRSIDSTTDGSIDPIFETEQYKRLKNLGQLSRKTSETLRCDREGCEYQTNVYKYLKQHRKKHNNAATEAKRVLRRELKSRCYDSTTNTYICDHTGCQRVFNLFELLTQHVIRRHIIEKVVCDYDNCGEVFKSRCLMRAHYRRTHTDPQLQCPHPNYDRMFSTPSQLKAHEVTHRTVRQFKGSHKTSETFRCDREGCEYQTNIYRNLWQHRKKHNNTVTEANRVLNRELKSRCYDSATNTYICDHTGCQRVYKLLERLRQHVIRSHAVEKVVCDYEDCGQVFKSMWTMRNHYRRTHTGRQLQCPHPDCGRLFRLASEVKAHEVTHRTVRQFKGSHKTLTYNKSLKCKNNTSGMEYMCPHEDCDHRYGSKHQLDRHLVAHQTERPFACDFEGCTKSYRNTRSLWRHRLDHMNAPTDGSIDPIYETEQYKRLKKLGQLRRKTSETFRCDREGCEYQTNVYRNLWQHRKKHNNAATEANRALNRDLKNRCYDSATNTYICDHTGCQRVYKLFVRLKNHVIRSHIVEKVVCDYDDCGEVFKSRHLMRNHYRETHTDPQLPCPHPDCDRMCRTPSTLKRHLLKHQTDRPFACNFEGCHKTYTSNDGLKNHQLIHSNERTIKCTVDGCTQLFLTKHIMNRHRIAVHNFKPYDTKKHTFMSKIKPTLMIMCEWPGCEYTTPYKFRMQTHQNIHTGERPYVCEWPECDKAFRDPSGLKTHMNIHKNVQPFTCHWPGCTYRSSDHSSRYKHIKAVHKM
ncbi:unnamed protein product, partial [Medioppia subpectinata]